MVKDEGIGIEEYRKSFLFKPFGELQANQNMKKVKDQNIGIGLSCAS